MGTLDVIKGLFQRKRNLGSITTDELRMEKIRLEQEQAKMSRKVEELERQKQSLFLRGKDEPSERQRRILATKIKELDVQAHNMDRQLEFVSKQLRIVNGFTQIKENERLLQQLGISSIISRMDIATLQRYVESASVEGQFHMEKFQQVLSTLEDTEKLVGPPEEEKDITEIMRAMEEAKAAEMESPETAEQVGLQRLNEALRAKTEEPEAEI